MSVAVSGSFLAPLNATSHWLFGTAEAARGGWMAGPTLMGLVTHVVASLFWACVLMLALRVWPLYAPAALFVAGLGTGVIALVVDYGILPRMLSPGWHLVLPWPAVIAGFLLLGAGLGLGAIAARPIAPRAV